MNQRQRQEAVFIAAYAAGAEGYLVEGKDGFFIHFDPENLIIQGISKIYILGLEEKRSDYRHPDFARLVSQATREEGRVEMTLIDDKILGNALEVVRKILLDENEDEITEFNRLLGEIPNFGMELKNVWVIASELEDRAEAEV